MLNFHNSQMEIILEKVGNNFLVSFYECIFIVNLLRLVSLIYTTAIQKHNKYLAISNLLKILLVIILPTILNH